MLRWAMWTHGRTSWSFYLRNVYYKIIKHKSIKKLCFGQERELQHRLFYLHNHWKIISLQKWQLLKTHLIYLHRNYYVNLSSHRHIQVSYIIVEVPIISNEASAFISYQIMIYSQTVSIENVVQILMSYQKL